MSVKKILFSSLAYLDVSAMSPVSFIKPTEWHESYPIPRIRSRGTCRRSRVSPKIRKGRRG